jgi:hypothetical protein
MTASKGQSHSKTRRVGSEPNLGQKAAKREKKSKAQLSHMEGARIPFDRRRLCHDLKTVVFHQREALLPFTTRHSVSFARRRFPLLQATRDPGERQCQ